MRKLSFAITAAMVIASIPAMSHAQLVATKKLLVKDTVDDVKFLVKIVAKDPAIDPTGADPTTGEGYQHFAFGSVDRDEVSNIVATPMANWTAKGTGYLYSDKEGVSGPVRKMKLRPGKLVLVGRGPGFNFPLISAPESGTMAFHLYGSMHNLCGVVPGMEGEVKQDDTVKGVYVGVNGEKPAFCPAIVVFD